MDLTDAEKGIIGVVRLNQSEKKDEWKWARAWRGLSVSFSWRSRNSLWGRFGGGWNWEVGVLLGGRTLIVHLLVCSLRFTLNRRKPA